MQRIIVDFPEPEGPQTTTTSCRATSRLMSLSTWNWPYHLFTCFREIITWDNVSDTWAGFDDIGSISIWGSGKLLTGLEPFFQDTAEVRHAGTQHEVNHAGERVGLDQLAKPLRIAHDLLG